ncbi:uncharacterized protein BEWA_004950 [Theileria equi strain WA]|uniref:Membrane protein, putative n=1 Tax=Theileria equi strain WA TaxID=1537102 RepID=L0AZR0_THEEQ|nr:uncharacterized protein BEWA_004950 [Theileria equi strain WA]AFZ81087.1 membrane protein, putative [Theileria equi strain WA]|eukprot:XP_004830753.1 uncharacterized protein BEWA_004950 [Theileria equi strain WA]
MEASDPEPHQTVVAPSAPPKEFVEQQNIILATNMDGSNQTPGIAPSGGNPKQLVIPAQVFVAMQDNDRQNSRRKRPGLIWRLGKGLCYAYLAIAGFLLLVAAVIIIVCVCWIKKTEPDLGTRINEGNSLRTKFAEELQKQRERFGDSYSFKE